MKSKGGGSLHKDRGMSEIRKQIAALSGLAVKAGITEDVGQNRQEGNENGPTIAQYAAWNEYGTRDGHIPSRPFIRGWVDSRREEIKATRKQLFTWVTEGKMDAERAIHLLGEFAQDGIKRYIINGNFEPNAESTKQRKKGSSQPLIDTGTMRNSVRYQVVKKDD